MTIYRKLAVGSAAVAFAAAVSTPASAATGFEPAALQAEIAGGQYEEASEYFGRYGRYRRYRHYRRRRGPSAGDIIAGIGIIAGIAVIADAASKNSRRRDRDRYPERRRDRDYPDRRASQNSASSDISFAIAQCSDAAERSAGENVRVEEIRSATRDGGSWRISGDLNDGRTFDCGASANGVDFVQLGNPRGTF